MNSTTLHLGSTSCSVSKQLLICVLKGLCHEAFGILDQFCAKIIT